MQLKKLFDDFIAQGAWEIFKYVFWIFLVPTIVARLAITDNFPVATVMTITLCTFAAGLVILAHFRLGRGPTYLNSLKDSDIEKTIHRWLDRKGYSVQIKHDKGMMFNFIIRSAEGREPTLIYRVKDDASMIAVAVNFRMEALKTVFNALNDDRKHSLYSTVIIEMLQKQMYFQNLNRVFNGESVILFGVLHCDESLSEFDFGEKIMSVQAGAKILFEIIKLHIAWPSLTGVPFPSLEGEIGGNVLRF